MLDSISGKVGICRYEVLIEYSGREFSVRWFSMWPRLVWTDMTAAGIRISGLKFHSGTREN